MTMHKKHRDWIEQRGIDPALAEKFGLATVVDETAAWLVTPYCEAGETINRKWRMTSDKRFKMDKGAPLALWNADALRTPEVRDGQAPLIITEGEMDALAAIQSGFPFAVSVPNGAPSSETKDLDEAKRYEWVDRHASDLAGVREFVIATDNDQPGHYLRSDLVALFGADRCRFIEYPEGCKDLNDVLLQHGREGVTRCIGHSKPFPVQGLYCIDDFPEKADVRAYDVGIEPIRDYLAIVPGTLTVVTGYANMGKSTMMNGIIAFAMQHHFPVCVASFETDVRPILERGILKVMLQCHETEIQRNPGLSLGRQYLRERLRIISQSVDEDMEMDVDRFLEICRVAVRRHGVKMIVLDPWNELEHKRRRDETETDYIGRAIRAIKRFAKQYDVAFWVVAHPSKPQEGNKKIPGLYDISGSANWANKADYGLTYHRPNFEENHAVIVVNKVRMGLPGQRGKVDVAYDFRKSCFVPFGPATQQRD